MPRLHPRQRLLRDAIGLALASVVALALTIWWMAAPVPGPDPSAEIQAVPVTLSDRAPATPPRGLLWRPVTDAPVVQAAPLLPPSMRLITISQRNGRWTALVDPGGGAAAERVSTGDQITGWTVGKIDADSVEVTSGTQRHSLRFGP